MTLHKQIKITIDSPLYTAPFSFRADAEIKGLLHDLNFCGCETTMSCAHNTEADTLWLYFSDHGFKTLMELAYQFICEGVAGGLFVYLSNNRIVNMVDAADDNLIFSHSLRVERAKVDWFTTAIHFMASEINFG